MINIDEFNAMFLACHPEIQQKVIRNARAAARKIPKVCVMALKPKYARAIYEGRKNWEFRKAPPPLFKTIYIYESAPVSKITGFVIFSGSITGAPAMVYELVKTNKTYTKNHAGISYDDLLAYAGKRPVTALRVHEAERLDHAVGFDAKPPQNWGTYVAKYRELEK